MFDVGKADATEGLLPDNPIRLDGIFVEDFRQLLRAIYRTWVDSRVLVLISECDHGPLFPPCVYTCNFNIADYLTFSVLWNLRPVTRNQLPMAKRSLRATALPFSSLLQCGKWITIENLPLLLFPHRLLASYRLRNDSPCLWHTESSSGLFLRWSSWRKGKSLWGQKNAISWVQSVCGRSARSGRDSNIALAAVAPQCVSRVSQLPHPGRKSDTKDTKYAGRRDGLGNRY